MQTYLSALRRSSERSYCLFVASAVLSLFFAVVLGVALGKLLGLSAYIGDYEVLIANDRPLPSRIYDANNNLITEISQGSRELLAQNELSRNLIYALMGREDSTFFEHNGFSLIGTIRAFVYIVLNRVWGTGTAGGGSTLTQQLAGSLKADRTDISVSRKLRELWWSFLFEKYYAKSEILVTYLNSVYFGDRNYGIEAASRFFFGHSARSNSIVESVLAVIQLARPNGDFSPLRNPEMARLRQDAVLDKIVHLGLMSRERVGQLSREYWEGVDLTKVSQNSPKRTDEAPYFSDYVARVLENELYGTQNLLQAGYSIYTTLDLALQREVDEIASEGMKRVDEIYQSQNLDFFKVLEQQELPELGRLRVILGLDLDLSGGRDRRAAQKALQKEFTPTLEALVTVLGLESRFPVLKMSAEYLDRFVASNVPETAMLAIDKQTGAILAMVGGRSYNMNEARLFNRAIDARVPPGSAFKPLYYAAAFEEQAMTSATILSDMPYRFISPNGDPYFPNNYNAGRYMGPVLPRKALQLSLNIPAVHVLDRVGFDQAVDISTRLLGISDLRAIRRDFPFVFPLAVGTPPVAPIQVLRAFTAFANQGIPIDPNPIRYVEDRNGQVVFQYEQQTREDIRDSSRRILSPQTAYIMTKMLESVPNGGTLFRAKTNYESKYGRLEFPLAAKSGTAENWSDGWAVGYTPRYAAVVWVGFDQAGNSLGSLLYGGWAAGPMFMRIMGLLHKNNEEKLEFGRPEGVYSAAIDRRNGYRWLPSCGEQNRSYEWFSEGSGSISKDCTQAPRGDGIFNYERLSDEAPSNIFLGAIDEIDISGFDFLREDSGDNRVNTPDNMQNSEESNDQFLEQQQQILSELDSLIELDN